MASTEKRTRKPRTTVPVVSRTQGENLNAATSKPRGRAVKVQSKKDRLDFVGYAILALVTIIFLLSVSVPLNNFYDGRAEIARLAESIEVKKAKKEQLLQDIEKYRSESYIEQEARRRLGLVTPGETAYRILDPKIKPDAAVTTDKKAQRDARQWYTVLWDSVAQPLPEEPLEQAEQDPQPSNAPQAPGVEGEAPVAPAVP